MNWATNFFIPLIQLIFYLGILIVFVGFSGYALYKNYIKTWKWQIKYKTKKPDEELINFLKEKHKDNVHPHILEMQLLQDDCSVSETKEMLYLYNKIRRQTK